MARPLYTARLISAVLADGDTAVYEPLDGQVAVIRDVLVTFEATIGYPASFQLDDTTTNLLLLWPVPENWFGTRHWQGRQVLLPGEVLTARYFGFTGLGGAAVRITGYVLSAP